MLQEWPTLDDAAGLKLLQSAAEALDVVEKCRVQIKRDGEMVTDRFGQAKSHPLLSVQRDARSAFLMAMKALNLDIEPPVQKPKGGY